MSDKIIKHPNTSDNCFAPSLNYIGNTVRVKFVGSCLKQDKTTFIHTKTVNIYIINEISVSNRGYKNYDYPTLENCLLDAARLTKNADVDKYKYSGYGIGFERRGNFLVVDLVAM